jgi:hypothetical protein
MPSSGMSSRATLVRTDVSEEYPFHQGDKNGRARNNVGTEARCEEILCTLYYYVYYSISSQRASVASYC